MNFGKYAIIDSVEHHFLQEPDWTWTIKPPTSGDELSMSKFLVQNRYEVTADGTRREFPPTYTEIAYREIALCFGGTTVPKDDNGPILKTGSSINQVETMLRQMPHVMVMEIWSAIADAIPGWGPNKTVRPLAQSQDALDEETSPTPSVTE